ncbi:MAG: hypothetical protein KC486_18315 [Myxococcales bacterium]|nr:hypothetical protein [Myxococcales bacterium]
MRGFSLGVVCVGALVVGCGGKSDASATATAGMESESGTTDGGSTSTGSTSNATSETTTNGGSMSATGTSSTTSAATTDDGTTGCSFLNCNDGGGGGSQCDPMVQDCPDGEKCTAVSPMVGEPWGINECVPVNGAGVVGDPCDIEGGKYTGLDDCALGYICLLTDDEGMGGTCVEFCDANMNCPNSGAMCVVYNDGSLPICLANCDPLLQDCAADQGCYPSGGDTFVCFKTSVDIGEGGVGDGCNYTNQCQPGLMCLSPDSVPDCLENGCCSPFCSVMEGNANCLDGQECVAYFEMGQAPPGYEDVGVCAIPM